MSEPDGERPGSGRDTADGDGGTMSTRSGSTHRTEQRDGWDVDGGVHALGWLVILTLSALLLSAAVSAWESSHEAGTFIWLALLPTITVAGPCLVVFGPLAVGPLLGAAMRTVRAPWKHGLAWAASFGGLFLVTGPAFGSALGAPSLVGEAPALALTLTAAVSASAAVGRGVMLACGTWREPRAGGSEPASGTP